MKDFFVVSYKARNTKAGTVLKRMSILDVSVLLSIVATHIWDFIYCGTINRHPFSENSVFH
jgi:hypothetical protein